MPVTIQKNPLPPDPSVSVGPRQDNTSKNGRPLENDGSTDGGSINWNIITIVVVSVMFLIIAILLVFLYMRTRPKEKEQPKRKTSTSNVRETILIEDTSSRGDESERGRPATPATPLADPSFQEQHPRSESEAEQRNNVNAQADMLSRLMTSIEALTLVMEGRTTIPDEAQHHTYPNHNVHLHHDHDARHNHSGTLVQEPRFQQYHYPPQAHPQHVPNHLPAHGTHPNSDLTHPHPHPHHPQQFASGYEPPSASRRPRPTPNNPSSGEQSSRSSIYDLPFDPKSNKGKKKDPS